VLTVSLKDEEIKCVFEYLCNVRKLREIPRSYARILKDFRITYQIEELEPNAIDEIKDLKDKVSKLESLLSDYMLKDYCGLETCRNKVHKGKWCKNHVCADNFCEMFVQPYDKFCEFHREESWGK
jgi:hypothetical protein